ncbi:glycosyl transferase, group 1 [Oscillatoria nigro-viridis PCC 7112]|uniref:Glycosyl transferase, group 1 n=1 Tax=Phormidium nigroviride PCC 7112 TaxID=179408 RepID=K9VM48_9CYAN|nr:glycosyl transferase, group 1 [Oscillatoria nigro-viridis PCC 7112]
MTTYFKTANQLKQKGQLSEALAFCVSGVNRFILNTFSSLSLTHPLNTLVAIALLKSDVVRSNESIVC